MPPALLAVFSAIGGALVASLPALLLYRSVQAKNRADSLATDAATSGKIFADLQDARSRILKLEEERDELDSVDREGLKCGNLSFRNVPRST